jgi:hypothetical protein
VPTCWRRKDLRLGPSALPAVCAAAPVGGAACARRPGLLRGHGLRQRRPAFGGPALLDRPEQGRSRVDLAGGRLRLRRQQPLDHRAVHELHRHVELGRGAQHAELAERRAADAGRMARGCGGAHAADSRNGLRRQELRLGVRPGAADRHRPDPAQCQTCSSSAASRTRPIRSS